MELTSTIHCPNCGFKKTEVLPTTVCQITYTCARCHQALRPKRGDCCVYCSYGSAPCPSKQQERLARGEV
jgi:hypothetical protein